MAKKRHITNKERSLVQALLTEHLQKLGDNLFKYNGDWNDAKIAQAVASDLSPNSVASYRQDVFGVLVQRAAAPRGEPDPRVDHIELVLNEAVKEIQVLISCVSDLISRFNTSVETLDINRVGGKYRHLKFDPQRLPMSMLPSPNGTNSGTGIGH